MNLDEIRAALNTLGRITTVRYLTGIKVGTAELQAVTATFPQPPTHDPLRPLLQATAPAPRRPDPRRRHHPRGGTALRVQRRHPHRPPNRGPVSAPTLLLDLDGPLADFDAHFWERCHAEGWAFDIDHPSHQRHRYFTDHIPDRAHRRAARAMVDAPGWFRHLPVTPGAREGVTAFIDAGIDLWVCTKPLEVNPTCRDDKAAWLADHFPELVDRLIIAPDKSMVHGDVLLDDAPKLEWFHRATWEPVIFDAPYNTLHVLCNGAALRWLT